MEKATIHRLEVGKVLTPEQLAKVQPFHGMGWHFAQGRIDMKGMDCRAGMDRMCCGAVAQVGQHPCRARIGQMRGGAGINCMRHRAGMGGDQTPCWIMR